ncbi:hypothetical protein C4K06_5112 [Pseudomonas chlororaphis subsp. aureofaciens]|uniref:hypothetical protein n=1 Tax=Pseudomonas chlororaphis TaxID=587753 RepID=UPI000F572289|nr:hypothetical protein [Pseudomonas chlororaphis]AZE38121.1 hypothetical protein C4K06_5112 [Pseudomonas chlororaphis subsp. aureofaciens]
MPSFYSDRTAEYALIPKFSEILKPLGTVVPIYFSGKREDTHVAFESLRTERFYLVAFFARRPKIDKAESRSIEGKINKGLFKVGRYASGLGIPTFCGISLTNNIFHQAQSEPLWFDISEMAYEEDVRFRCEVSGQLKLEMFDGPIYPMNQSSVLSKVTRNRTLDWEDVTFIMRELPKLADEFKPQFMFLSQAWRLKPVYFAIRLPRK